MESNPQRLASALTTLLSRFLLSYRMNNLTTDYIYSYVHTECIQRIVDRIYNSDQYCDHELKCMKNYSFGTETRTYALQPNGTIWLFRANARGHTQTQISKI